MHDDSALVERRIRRELMERVMPAMYRASVPLAVTAWEAPGEPVPYAQAVAALDTEGRPFTVGDHYGRPWGTTWFRFAGELPAGWSTTAGCSPEFVVDLGFHPDAAGFQSEGLVWLPGADGQGLPVQGIHPRRTAVPLAGIAGTAGPVELIVEAASNPAFPQRRMTAEGNLGSLRTAGDRPLYRLRQATLSLRDDEVYHLLLDIEVLLGLMTALAPAEARRQRILRTLQAAFDALDLDDIAGTAAAARAVLAPALALPARSGAHRVVAAGHAHIDSAWLWPVRETIRKCARTFASATRMMDDDPAYRFVCSQAVQYQWMEDHYPALFQRIRERVANGQWQPVGAMWVEADMNLPSGESLVRQLVHGQRYFEVRFGVRCKEVWIPDVFGYPASLPQLFRGAGCDRFITQKLSWNKQNRFPHSTFRWRGLDGSEVLTHFPPVDTYNATVVGEELVFSEHNFKDHGWSDWSLMPFGHGNGGGGPTREMIQRAHRFADLDGAPRVTMGTTEDFFAQVEAERDAGAPVPRWDGELYFEMHRGTLTSQARTKVGNRRCEQLLREAELWWAAVPTGVPDAVTAELDRLWKDVLLQQFHDIIPGSSITWVYEDAEAEHERVAARLEELIAEALAQVAPSGMIANPSAFTRTEVVADATGALVVVSAPGFGFGGPATVEDRVVTTEHSFTNGFLSVAWDLDGEITSIIDVHAGRELLPDGRHVSLELAPDHPVEYDAWDVEAWTRGLGRPVGGVHSVTLREDGPLRATLEVRRAFGRSTVVQRVVLRAGSPRLDLAFDIDWHEDEALLSLHVPLDVHAREAACGIQFGHVVRPTHQSTSWDAAKFEVCAHRWVDLAEPGWGVAILDDGRYGHSVQEPDGGGVRISLLRAAKYPDPEQDHGRHAVTIAVMPHGPGLEAVVREAEVLNTPLRWVAAGPDAAAGASAAAPPLVAVDGEGIELSAVKRADDGSGDLVVRVAEVCGARRPVTLRMPARIQAASLCNLLEEPHTPFEVGDGIVVHTLRPFEVATLRLSTTP